MGKMDSVRVYAGTSVQRVTIGRWRFFANYLKGETEGQNYSFLFDGLVLSYRNSDEGSQMRMLEHLHQHYAHLEYGNWTLFKMKNSSYLEWFAQESLERYEGIVEVEHYVFLTSNDVIEVLSADSPTITKIV